MAYKTSSYRYPNENMILWATVLLVMFVIAVSATATLCLSAVFVVGMLFFSYSFARSRHEALMTHARQVTPASMPNTAASAQEAGARLQVEPVDIFVSPSRILNAFTFGLSSPKTIVLNSALFDVMDRDELQFIIGHEMGHVCLSHTWLNSLIGGMAGIPSSSEASILMVLAFRWWNRACELSADRAGVLACSNPAKAISALIKLHAGPAGLSKPANLERALQSIEVEDDSLINNLEELLATHPMIVKRIQQIRSYTATSEYASLQARLNKN
jgi:Zn-dependent protease with chaperone function